MQADDVSPEMRMEIKSTFGLFYSTEFAATPEAKGLFSFNKKEWSTPFYQLATGLLVSKGHLAHKKRKIALSVEDSRCPYVSSCSISAHFTKKWCRITPIQIFFTANKILHEDYKELIPRGIIKKGGAKIGYAW